MSTQSDTDDLGSGDPGSGDPGSGDPGSGDPGSGDSGSGDPDALDMLPAVDGIRTPPLQGRRLARLGSLIGGFAHEIKNPLSTIGLNLRLMEEELTEPLTVREGRVLARTQRLVREVGRLEGILDDFLNYVRAPQLAASSVSLNEIVRELADLVGPGMEKDGISLRIYLTEGLPMLEADPRLLHQALLNLVTNAHQALADAGSKGEVLITTGVVESGGRHFHTLAVIDSGPGIGPDIKERCFAPYFSTKKGGTGLGLAITQRLVEEHGGDISLESEPGSGTRFLIRLPSARSAPRAAATVDGGGT